MKEVTKKVYCEDYAISILAVSVWDLTACSFQKHQYYHDTAMSTGTTALSSPSKTEPSGWQILSMSTSVASITKHHICTRFVPKEFGGELLSNLHNLYMLCIIARVRSWALLWKSKSCFSYQPADRCVARQKCAIVISRLILWVRTRGRSNRSDCPCLLCLCVRSVYAMCGSANRSCLKMYISVH